MKPSAFHISRRSFLKSCAITTAATGLPLWFLEEEAARPARAAETASPSERPGVALIGCGNRGTVDGKAAARFGDMIAVCDLDQEHLDRAVKTFSKDGKAPERYSDFRKVLERKDIHIIVNGTPDHWHTLVNLGA